MESQDADRFKLDPKRFFRIFGVLAAILLAIPATRIGAALATVLILCGAPIGYYNVVVMKARPDLYGSVLDKGYEQGMYWGALAGLVLLATWGAMAVR